VTFTFTVTNVGDVPLSDITVADDKCPNATLKSKTGGNQDAILDLTETWTYTCTMTIPAHQAGEQDPIHNTVTTTGKTPSGKTVNDTDSHDTDLLHPAIDIEKTGPATATAGDVLTYSLAVTNPGDMPFASDKVVVTDPGCDDQPTQTSVNGDASPGRTTQARTSVRNAMVAIRMSNGMMRFLPGWTWADGCGRRLRSELASGRVRVRGQSW
jgi:hypothetical protein